MIYANSVEAVAVLELRKVAKELAYRRRGVDALSSNEQVELRRMKSGMVVLMVRIRDMEEKMRTDVVMREDDRLVLSNRLVRWRRFFRLYWMRYVSIAMKPKMVLPAIKRLNRDISFFESDEYMPYFRFKYEQLMELSDLLGFKGMFTLSNRARVRGQEILLRGLYELTTGEGEFAISRKIFGGDQSLQSRSFSSFVDHIEENFSYLVDDNLQWFYDNGFHEASCRAIERKMMETYKLEFPEGWTNKVALFVDCNCQPTSCPGGGPAEDGANAERWTDSLQRSFYNGWKSVHGLKCQTVDDAFGITEDHEGPVSLR